MEKVFLYLNQGKFNNEMKPYHLHVTELSDILEAYKALGLPDMDDQEFRSLIFNPKELIFDKITGNKNLELNGHLIDKSKSIDMVARPDGYDQMEALILGFKQRINWSFYLNNSLLIDGEICVSPSVEEKIKENCSYYAKTEKQLRAYKFAKFVLDKSEELYGVGKMTNIGGVISELLPQGSHISPDKKVNICYDALPSFDFKL